MGASFREESDAMGQLAEGKEKSGTQALGMNARRANKHGSDDHAGMTLLYPHFNVMKPSDLGIPG